MRKNILITGAGGFVGRNLHEHLGSKYNVFAATRKELDLLNEDKVAEYIQKRDIHCIIHCANVGGSRKDQSNGGNISVLSDNLRMFHHLVKCLRSDMHMIYFGSGAEYDKSRNLTKIKEIDFGMRVPKDEYGFSKYVMSKCAEKQNNITCLRIFGLYGRYEDYTYKFISNAILKNIMSLPIRINQNVIFDYLYINDLLNIVERFIDNPPKNRVLNVTPTNSIDLVSIANMINEISQKQNRIDVVNEGLNYEYTGDNSFLLGELNNYRFTSYHEGVSELFKYYTAVIDTIDRRIIQEDPYIKTCRTRVQSM